MIKNGTQGVGKVLTSDADGKASWETPETGAWTYNNSNIYFNSGSVGIGTTSPSFDLDVINTSDNAVVRISAPNNNGFLVIDRANQNYIRNNFV